MISALLFLLLGLNDLSADSWRARESASRRATLVALWIEDTGDLEADRRLDSARRSQAKFLDRLQVWVDLEWRWNESANAFAAAHPAHLGQGWRDRNDDWKSQYEAWCDLRALECRSDWGYLAMLRAWMRYHGETVVEDEPAFMPYEP